MAFEQDDYREMLDKRLKEERDRRAPELRRMMAAGAAVESLTGDSRWDYYRSLVQERIEEQRKIRDEAEERLHNPFIVKAEDVMEAKMARAIADAVVMQLEWAVGLPLEVIEAGKQAKKVLDA